MWLNQVWQKERLVRSKTIYFWESPRKYLLSEWPSARIWAATQPHGENKNWQRQERSIAPFLEYPVAMKIVNTRNTCITPRVMFHTTSGWSEDLKKAGHPKEKWASGQKQLSMEALLRPWRTFHYVFWSIADSFRTAGELVLSPVLMSSPSSIILKYECSKTSYNTWEE